MRNDLDDVDRMVLSMKACVEAALAPPTLVNFEISLSEALANLVKHAKSSDPSKPIEVALFESTIAVHVEIFDPIGAAAFDLRDHAQPLNTIDPLAESGRGLGLILQCSEHTTYGLKANRMRLSLTFLKSGD